LSVASGISPYRGAKNAIWEKYVTDWATRTKFTTNPLQWWNKFWLRTHETPEFLEAEPNRGHAAIKWIVDKTGAKVITQNIDNLHIKSGMKESDLVEIHGRLGLYRCTNSLCPYATLHSIHGIDTQDLAKLNTSLWDDNLELKKVPKCELCGHCILPQSLLFDEDYDSHSFYKMDIAEQWIHEHDILVFVGTSFSVGITQNALDVAKRKGKTVYNFNLFEEAVGTCVNMNHVLGKSEQTLPKLAKKLHLLHSRPRLWYPIQSTFARLEDSNSSDVTQRELENNHFHSTQMDYELSAH